MERIEDRDALVYSYPHVKFTNVTSNQHLKPFLKQSGGNIVSSYAIKRGTVIETGPFF